MTKDDRRNAYLYCKFRDEQFAMYTEFARKKGMMTNTFFVVNALFYAPEGLRQKEICERTHQTKQTVSVIIRNLQKEGSVTMRECPENRREKIVQMTEAGRKKYEQAVRHITIAEDSAMGLFTVEEQEQLIWLSRRFTENLRMLIEQDPEDSDQYDAEQKPKEE